jgi:predicted SAM-dependent methyltransferase
MENYQCLVCNQDMEMHHKIAYIDLTCNKHPDHRLTMRIIHNVMMDTKTLAKLRIAFDNERLHLKVHYDQKYSEVWSKNNSSHRIKINHIIAPDFTDLEKLKNKIRMLLVFS